MQVKHAEPTCTELYKFDLGKFAAEFGSINLETIQLLYLVLM